MSQPTPLKCTRCQPCGPALLPVRYAVIPDTISPKLPAWAQPETPFPVKTEGYDYALRAMRAGFLYVYYEGNKTWEAWSITPDGGLWKQKSAPAAQPKISSVCTESFHKSANIEFIVLNPIALRTTVWVAFSPYKWNPALFDLYGNDAARRKKRMQPVEYWHWTGPEEEHGIAQATEANLKTVLDYQPVGPDIPRGKLPFSTDLSRVSLINPASPYYNFASDAIRPRTTLYPWSDKREGKSSETLKALQTRGTNPDGTPIKPLLMAVNDPIGITHELTGWCDDFLFMHQRYRDELAVEYATYYHIKGLEKVIKQAEAQTVEQQSWKDLIIDQEKMTANYINANPNIPKEIRDRYPIDNNDKKYDAQIKDIQEKSIINAWFKYEKTLNKFWMADFEKSDQALKEAIDKKIKIAIDLRLPWLKSPLFIECITDFHSDETQDHLNFREAVGYALASINLSEAGEKQIREWIDRFSSKEPGNLVWRYQLFNSPQVMAFTEELLQKIKSQKQPSAWETIKEDTQYILDKLSVYADAADRALSAMIAGSQGSQSLMQRTMSWGDRTLTTITNEALKGTIVESAQGRTLRAIFMLDAGVTKVELAKMMNNAISYPNGDSIFAPGMLKNMQAAINNQLNQEQGFLEKLKEYKNRYDNLANTEEGKQSLKVFRIKSLGVVLFATLAASLTASSSGSVEDRTKLSVPLLFAGSSLAALIEEAYSSVIQKETQAKIWKCAGATMGSIAAGLTVILDVSDLATKVKKEGLSSYSTALACAKLISDSAYAIGALNELLIGSNQLLVRMGKTGFKFTLLATIEDGAVRFAVTKWIGYLASWQVMVTITIVQVLYEIFRKNELQLWCQQSVFGNESTDHNTMQFTASEVSDLLHKQEAMLQQAIEEVFNLPPSAEKQKQIDELRQKTLKNIYKTRGFRYL
ncbi:T6SS effector BTH_I2691 family protein [Serratia sp. DD3]|uniref:T6SS effector BTH_I2691 family protein n=1 Tax=Serratia sp. DD3 TaxID=1410619 RepID=UPI0004D76028|nr:T6SS effector BTH_I2691 family protein [Serratia sp. DD3]KEY59310.1 hypothetical protein SRDD_15900 [Serratia sp. DD3]